MIHSFILAAATCSMGASVQSADALLSKADAAITQRDKVTAKTSYDAAMDALNAANWFPKDKSCDEPRYALQRYVTTLHSLSVAVAGGLMPASEASQHLRDVQDGIYRLLPISAIDVFIRQYPELKSTERKYIMAVESAAQPQKIAAHEPKDSGCEARNVDAEVLEAVPAYRPDDSPVGNDTQSIVKVNVAADGSIASASIARSTYDLHLDQAALAAAIESTYLPAVKNCLPTAGSLNFAVTFQPRK